MESFWKPEMNGTEWENENSTLSGLNSSRWLLAGDIHGPVIAAFVTLEFILALVANMFIVVHTIRQCKTILGRSSTLLLFLLAICNLVIVVLYMPFTIIASASEEWIFGRSDSVRSAFCQVHAFTFVFSITAFIHILAVISVDRCLSITKTEFYRKYMTWRVTLGIVIVLMVIGLLSSLAPYYGQGIGEYNWSRRLGSCFAIFVGHPTYVLLQAIHALIPLSTIITTTIWTFIFTRGFLKRNLKMQQSMLSIEGYQAQKEIYNVRVKNLIGIFGSLILFNLISWMPYVVVSIIGLGIGLDKIPNQVFSAGWVIFLFTNVSNPVIQIYFRKDLVDILKKIPFINYIIEKASSTASCMPKSSKVHTESSVMDHRNGTAHQNGAAVNNNSSTANKGVIVSESGSVNGYLNADFNV